MTRLLSLKSLSLVLSGVLLVASPMSAAQAADKAPADKSVDTVRAAVPLPDPMQNPALANMIKLGVKLYYLGMRSNMEGWLILKDGQLQMVYIPVGTTDLILGAMFDKDGKNVTSDQIDDLVKTNPQVAQDMASGASAKQQSTAGTAPTESAGEKLLHQMDNAYGVFVGDAAAPAVDMIMDANCKHCQASWKVLRDSVMAKKLRLHLIPIANPGSDNERAGGVLLHIVDPLKAWDKYVAGDGSALPGTPDQAAISALRANHALIDNWNIDETPYFVYRSKAGSVKIIRGEIKADHLNDLLTDVTP